MKSYYQNFKTNIGNFTNQSFSGYTGSGDIYLDEICFGERCSGLTVYAVTEILSDQKIYKEDAAYGVLGFGPNSKLWNSFIDEATGSANFSISLLDQIPLN